jgi:uncharacterized membrane protein YccC
LGNSLATALRNSLDNEETQHHLHEMRDGLRAMADDLDRAIQQAGDSPQGQKVRQEMERAAESLRAAGEQAWDDARPHLLSGLQQLNTELDRLVQRMERSKSEPDTEVPPQDPIS